MEGVERESGERRERRQWGIVDASVFLYITCALDWLRHGTCGLSLSVWLLCN